MSPIEELPGRFEQQVRDVLEDSVTRIDGRIRSRLNQARHAAVAEAARRRPIFWRRFVLMPAAGAVAAAVLVAFILWPHSPQMELPVAEGGHATVEDLDLLADGDGLDLVSSEESDGSFFEWAVEQTDSSETST
ncbi:MAG: hypothetical protein ACREVV_18660 [Steroidobacteraceae bacterium]